MHTSTSGRRVGRGARIAAWVMLTLSVLAGLLVVALAYAVTLEYGDTRASPTVTSLHAVRDFGVGILATATLAATAVLVARGPRWVVGAAAAVVAVTLAGVPAAAVVGAGQKYARYPAVPACTSEFSSGPAAPVVRSAQAVFDELDHPAPFSGGGFSGIDGCSSQLMVRDDVDPRASYRGQLVGGGWVVVEDTGRALVAVRSGQRFELTRDEYGDWAVWVGPADRRERNLPDGRVGPRR